MPADLKKLFLSVLRVPAFLCAAVLCYYIVGALLTHRIDLSAPQTGSDDPRAIAAALIERETVKHVYTPGPLFYEPAAVLDNMPAFQRGIIAAAALLSEASGDAEAAALLSAPANRRASVPAFRRAAVLLRDAAGKGAPFPPSAVKDLIADAQDRLTRHVLRREMYFVDLKADDVFYFTKGELYAALLILRSAKRDERTEGDIEKALFLLQRAIGLQPLIVLNVSPSSQFAPNHLTGTGFYVGGALDALKKAEEKLR